MTAPAASAATASRKPAAVAPGAAQSDLETTRIASRTYLTRRRASRLDASTVIAIMVALLLLIPTRYIVPGMTDLGRPGLVIGLLLVVWWLTARFAPHLAQPGPQPIRWAVAGFAFTTLISYAVAMLRPLTSMEANSADRAILYLLIFAGVALAAADGIRNWQRLDKVLDVIVICGAIVSAIALVQFVFQIDLTRFLAIPGLEQKYDALGFEARGEAVRVASTMTHYLELATTLATILPFALHRAIFATSRRRRHWAIVASLLITGGSIATVSRSGIIALALVALVLFPAWSWRLRYNMLFVGGLLATALVVVDTSLITTFMSLFLTADSDNSVLYRTMDYPVVWEYVRQNPWLGRGTGTYVVPQYQILDNQWLMFLITNGFVGVALFAAMHLTGVVIAVRAARRAATPEIRNICMGLAGTQIVAIVVAATYDSMSFLTYATMVALTLGMCGAVWRLTHPDVAVRTAAPRWFASDGRSTFLRQYIRPERPVTGR